MCIRDRGGIFASALSAGTLITTAAEDMVLYPEHEGVEFAVFLNQEEVCRFLYKNDKFYMDNGLYAISLLPADAETEEQESYMRQEQERLDRMLEEVLGRTDENAASPEGE